MLEAGIEAWVDWARKSFSKSTSGTD